MVVVHKDVNSVSFDGPTCIFGCEYAQSFQIDFATKGNNVRINGYCAVRPGLDTAPGNTVALAATEGARAVGGYCDRQGFLVHEVVGGVGQPGESFRMVRV